MMLVLNMVKTMDLPWHLWERSWHGKTHTIAEYEIHGFCYTPMRKVIAWQNSYHMVFVMRYGFCQVAWVIPCVTLYDPRQAVMASCIYLLLEKFPIDWSVCNQVESGFTSADWSLRAVWCNQLCKKTAEDCRPHQSRLHALSKIKVWRGSYPLHNWLFASFKIGMLIW